MAFDKETAKTANKFYTNGKGMYMLLFDNYSVITSGTSEGPTDDVYLRTESGNPVGAEWKDAVTNEPVSLTVSAGATLIPFTGLVKSPEGAISIDKGSSIELSVQPQPTDTTDSITYNWSVDDSYLSYLADNNKCIITGVAAGATTVTVTPVVNGEADNSKAVSFATTVIPVVSVSTTSLSPSSWTVGETISSIDLTSACGVSISEGNTLIFETSSLPDGVALSTAGVLSGTPSAAASGTIEVYVYAEGYEDDTKQIININYTIAEAEAGDSNVAAYNVTAAHWTANEQYTKFNGTYSLITTTTGTEAVYKNENGCVMKWANGTWGWSFFTDETSSYPTFITYEISADPANANDKTTWWNEAAVVEFPAGTITLVTDEGGSDSGSTEVPDYVVSGAGTEIVNGNYVVDTSTNYTAYKNTETNVYLWFNSDTSPVWVFSSKPGEDGGYSGWYYFNTAPMNGGSSSDASQGTYSVCPAGTAPGPTVTKSIPIMTANMTSCQLPSMTAGVAMSDYDIVYGCQISISNGGTLAFEVRSTLPDGLSFSNGIFSGTPTTAGNGTIEVYVYPQGYSDNGVTITASYTIAEASVAFTGLNKITANPSVTAGDSVTLELSILPENCTDSVSISWTTSDSNYTVTPSSNGLSATVEFLAAGNFDIYATPVVNGNTHSDSYISWFCRVAEAESGDSGSTEINYLYTVSGCSTTGVDGDYYDMGETFNDTPIYTNGTYYLLSYTTGWWGIFAAPNSLNAPICSVNNNLDTPIGEYSDGVSVTEYDSSGDSDSGDTTGYNIVCSDYPDIAGNYYEADKPSWGDSSYTAWYKHETKNYYLYITPTAALLSAFDDFGFTSPSFNFDTAVTNPVEVQGWVNADSGNYVSVTITQIGSSNSESSDSGSGGGESSGSGDSGETTYLYTVSGSSTASVNGDYWQDGTMNGKGKYTNGSCDMVWISAYWAIGPIGYNGNGAPYHSSFEDTATPISSNWSGVTVTEYAGNSGGSDSDSTTAADYIVTGAGSTEADGDYFATGETRTIDGYGTFPIYKNSNNIYLYFSSQCGYSWMPGWCLSPNIIDSGDGMLYCTQCGEGASQYPTGMLESWSSLDGVSPYPKCYACDENGEAIIPADYVVSGAGTAAVNGDYYITGSYIDNDTSMPIYKHETNDVYLFADGSNSYISYEPIRGAAYYYTCECYSTTIQTGNWEDATYPSCGGGETPYPTVTKN